MEKLRLYIESNLDEEFNWSKDCEKIVKRNMQENFAELCLCIKKFLDTDKSRYICQFSMIKLCYHLTIESHNEFLFVHFQNIVLPSIINYIYNNQMYSKELEPKVQQYINSSVIMCQELVSFWAHAYPQTKDFQPSNFLGEYQTYKNKQKHDKIKIRKKKEYSYLLKQINNSIHNNYKQIKQQWNSQNLVFVPTDDEQNSSEFYLDDENKILDNNSQKDILQQQQIDLQKQQLKQDPQEIEKISTEIGKISTEIETKIENQQFLIDLQQQIDLKKQELNNITQEVENKKEELQQLFAQINSQIKRTNISDSTQSNNNNKYNNNDNNDNCTILSFSINEKPIFDSIFNFDCEKQHLQQQNGSILLVSIDTSYPEKKQRLLDGRGVFHIRENYLLARQLKVNENTIDVAIYLKCGEKKLQDLRAEIKCDYSNQIYSNLLENKNLKPEQQVKFEIRNIEKSQIYQKDIKIDLVFDSQEIVKDELSFYLKLTNIVSYSQANENDLVKEYQNIHQCIQSGSFPFDDEAFPNGLMDVQKCIQYSINYNNQGKQLFLPGKINDLPFICRITLDQEGQAQVSLKKRYGDEELAKKLVLSYADALKKN